MDGFCEETRTVYEFYGCVYHGCPLCFDRTNNHPFHSERKMNDVYEVMIEREERSRALGFTVKTIWEHDYRKLTATDEMQLFLDMFDIITDSTLATVYSRQKNYFVRQRMMKELNMWISLLFICMSIRQRSIQQVTRPLFVKISNLF